MNLSLFLHQNPNHPLPIQVVGNGSPTSNIVKGFTGTVTKRTQTNFTITWDHVDVTENFSVSGGAAIALDVVNKNDLELRK